MVQLIIKLKNYWHTANVYYLMSLRDSCVDATMNEELADRIRFHNEKIKGTFAYEKQPSAVSKWVGEAE